MKIGRRGFLGLMAGFLAAPRAKLSRFAGLIEGHDYTFRNFQAGRWRQRRPIRSAKVNIIGPLVIGQYADYYAEWDGMVEIGPGCSERLDARKAAGETASETAARNPIRPMFHDYAVEHGYAEPIA